MSLDLPTLLVVSALVIVLTAGMFVSHAWTETGEDVDRVWALAFVAAVATTTFLLVAVLAPDLWPAVPLVNGFTALTVWAMWAGVRLHTGRRPLVGVLYGVPVLTALASAVHGPDGGYWAGEEALLAATAAGGYATGAAILRSHLRRDRLGVMLAVILLGHALFYTFRLVLFVGVGPEGRAFLTYAGTEVATLVNVLVIVGAAFCMVALRASRAQDRRVDAANFDPMTGARTSRTFPRRAQDVLDGARGTGRPAVLVAVAPEGVQTLGAAFGAGCAEQAMAVCGEVLQMVLPARAVLGRDALDGRAFQVVLTGCTVEEAHEWADELRKELIDTPVPVPGGHMRVTASVGVVDAADHGFDLEAMCDAARDLSRSATAAGGNRVARA